jgi:acyl-homoserine lactone acylase PvdQ
MSRPHAKQRKWWSQRALFFAVFALTLPAAAAPVDGRVTITRDHWGVPHIVAKSEEEGFYGLGWAEAEDTLPELLALFLVAEGKGSAAFGKDAKPLGESVLPLDIEAARWRHAEEAKLAYARLSPRVRRQQEAFIAGIRRFMTDHPEKMPAWAPQVQPWQPIALTRSLLWFFDIDDGMRACAKEGVKPDGVVPKTALPSASNAWVVSGKHTADGRTIVLSDPHGDVDGSLFYEFTMRAGALDVGGYAIGSAMVLVHTPKVAWGLTTGGPSVSTCYRLPIAPDGSYVVHGKTASFERRDVVLAVAGAEPVRRTFEYAQINGRPAPIIARNDRWAFAVSTPYFDDAGGLHEQLDAMIRARTTDEVLKANRRQGLFPQNLVVGDSLGSIAYLRAGRTPRRNPSIDWSVPVAGDDPRTAWQGDHPYTDLLLIRDPPEGILQNANYPPGLMPGMADHKSVYPAYILNDVPSLQMRARGERILQVLRSSDRLTLDQAKALAIDEGWFGAESWTRLLASAVARNPDLTAGLSAEGRAVLARLTTFDGQASAGSVAALNHLFWRTALWESVNPSERKDLVETVEQGRAPSSVLGVKIIDAVEEAVRRQASAVGGSDRPFGALFRIGRGTQDWPLGGAPSLLVPPEQCTKLESQAYACVQTLRAFSPSKAANTKTYRAVAGSRALRLVQLGDPIRSFSAHNYGQSVDPASPHYEDQSRDLESPARLKEVPFDFMPNSQAAESTEVLEWSRSPR